MTTRTKENTPPPGYQSGTKGCSHTGRRYIVVDSKHNEIAEDQTQEGAISAAWEYYFNIPKQIAIVSRLKRCARCGLDHTNLEFRAFRSPPTDSPFTHWCTCPTTQEPILMQIRDVR